MTYLTTDNVLDDVQTMIPDQTTAMRTKLLAWLNIAARTILAEREWKSLLKTSAAITLASNKGTLPSDFSTIENITHADFFFDRDNELSDEDIFDLNNTVVALDTVPSGYSLTPTEIVFYPGAEGDIVIKYYPLMSAALTDSSTATIFPFEFEALFIRTLLDWYYEQDSDVKTSISFQLNAMELSRVKKWDNRFKLITKRAKYIRDRI